ncbi:MAG: GTPase Der [Candidatus Heimdallarchaeota archaeon LC_2]|nr:MAG: GTPase Der [Candidatus Heimdallarchaeota archaeon LC_2]
MTYLSSIIDGNPRKAIISIIGPSNAGKTTLVKFLETGLTQKKSPSTTLGVDYRKNHIKIENWEFSLIDVGGQVIFQELFWDISVQKSDGIIFIIDATINPDAHKNEFENQIEQFNYALDILNEDTVLLILLNKQDLKELNPLQPTDFIKLVKNDRFKSTTTGLLPASAKYGDGVKEAFMWLAKNLSDQNYD